MKTEFKNKIERKLEALYIDAEKDYMRMSKGKEMSTFSKMRPEDFKDAYLPISKFQGENLRDLIIKHNCKHVIEFGASFGISTIYLAHGVSQTGGKIISTELIESKQLKAIQNIKEAGLASYVDIRLGDAMDTLKGNTVPIDLLFLDGWKDLYLPLFKILESQFHSGTIVYADNMNMTDTTPYADYLSSNTDKYSTRLLHDGSVYLSRVA